MMSISDNVCMTGLVTESVEDLYEMSPISLTDLSFDFKGPAFVSFGEVMDGLGIPEIAYRHASMRLQNGRKVPMSDPQLGWGLRGFGYYMTTFIGTAV